MRGVLYVALTIPMTCRSRVHAEDLCTKVGSFYVHFFRATFKCCIFLEQNFTHLDLFVNFS